MELAEMKQTLLRWRSVSDQFSARHADDRERLIDSEDLIKAVRQLLSVETGPEQLPVECRIVAEQLIGELWVQFQLRYLEEGERDLQARIKSMEG